MLTPRKYTKKIASSYKAMFGQKLDSNIHLPIIKGDHPELETLVFLDTKGAQKHQSRVTALQQAISLGSLDNSTAVIVIYPLEKN